MPTGINELAPEIEILPASWDVAVTAHGLPGAAAHQCHRIHHIAGLQLLPLPGMAVSHPSMNDPPVVTDADEGMNDSRVVRAGLGKAQTALASLWVDCVVGIQHPAPGGAGGCKGGVSGRRQP